MMLPLASRVASSNSWLPPLAVLMRDGILPDDFALLDDEDGLALGLRVSHSPA